MKTSEALWYNKKVFSLAGMLIIIILTCIAYSNSFHCSFQFDDNYNIVENPTIKDLSHLKPIWNFFPERFVGYLSFAINYHFHKFNVFGYHLVNLIIHISNALLVWWLIRLIFFTPFFKDKKLSKSRNILGFCTAILFATHPLATQSVTYIVQRFASLSTFFYLLSIIFYIKARLNNINLLKGLCFSVSLLSAVLGMFTKEIVFTLPFIIILCEFSFFEYKDLKGMLLIKKNILLWVIVLLLILILPVIYPLGVFKNIPPDQGNIYTLTPYTYLLTQFRVIVTYLRLLILPVHQMLDYNYSISKSLFELKTISSLLFLILLILYGIKLFKTNRIASFAIFWFFITLSVESSIIPIANVIFEHRTYLPGIGFFLFLTLTLFHLFKANKHPSLFIGFIVLISASYSIMTYNRNKAWKDEYTLWADNVKKAPGKARPWNNLGLEKYKRGDYPGALADFEKSYAINPSYILALNNRGLAKYSMRNYIGAIFDYNKVLEMEPRNKEAYLNRGVSLFNIGELSNAYNDFDNAIKIDPHFAQGYLNRGVVKYKFNDLSGACQDWEGAVQLGYSGAQSLLDKLCK